MFRIQDGKMCIFGRYVSIENGAHTMSIDTSTGSIYTDSTEGTPVVLYTLDELTGHVSIESLMPPMTRKEGVRPVRSMNIDGGSVLSVAPLFDEPAGAGTAIVSVNLEGFLFSFNYYAMANIAMGIIPFLWTGGRVCFSSSFDGGSNTSGKYTALPASMSCGSSFSNSQSSGVGKMQDIAGMYGGVPSGTLGTAGADAMEFYGNSVSIVFSYRSHRKFLFFASNVNGLFTSPLGDIGGSADSVSPGGAIPDVGNVEFEYSMFNLRQ